jgi:phage gp46-like protein
MNDLQNFEGDLLLEDTPDGGDIQIKDGLFVPDRTFSTAVYLSLFGGNIEDSGKVKNTKTWWGNTLEKTAANERLVSRFQALIAGLPMTTKNINAAEKSARLDLNWIIEEGAADTINVSGSATAHNKFSLRVEIKAGGKSIYENTFAIFWKAGIYGSSV